MFKLLNCPFLDINHDHTVDFENRANQIAYFDNRVVYRFNEVQYNRKLQNIRVPLNVEECELVNYVAIQNSPYNDRWYYYFVNNKSWIAKKVCEMELVLDVFQTYMFDFTIQQSFIDRCHMPRWDQNGHPIINTQEEGLQFGDYIEGIKVDIYDYQDKGSLIICASDPLGVMDNRKTESSTPSNGGSTGGVEANKPISWNLLRIIKGFEGFADTMYHDENNHPTIGYGINGDAQKEMFDKFASSDRTEKTATLILKDMLYTFANTMWGQLNEATQKRLTQNQFDAIVNIAFNVGAYGIKDLITLINNNASQSQIAEEWMKYTSGGLPGLVARRADEVKMYFENVYTYRQIPIIDANGHITGSFPNDGFKPEDMKEVS